MNVMAEAHRRARYEHDLQTVVDRGVFSPSGVTMSNVAEWRRRAAAKLGPTPGTDSYHAILAEELRYIHHRNKRIANAQSGPTNGRQHGHR